MDARTCKICVEANIELQSSGRRYRQILRQKPWDIQIGGLIISKSGDEKVTKQKGTQEQVEENSLGASLNTSKGKNCDKGANTSLSINKSFFEKKFGADSIYLGRFN